jgi:prepilin-type N-terminal cleavage/methylation domain-containing protein
MKNKGFTLIELLVVILIIGILLALIIPNFVLFQERARRSSVKNNMHVVQTALEAYATDHYGVYPSADVAPFEDPEGTSEDGAIAPYFPGGDPYGDDGAGLPGRFPTNPYTGMMYNDPDGDLADLFYGEDYELDEAGQAAIMSYNADAPYVDAEATDDAPGSVAVWTYADENNGNVMEYGISGWGKDVMQPMYDRVGEDDLLYFILHN